MRYCPSLLYRHLFVFFLLSAGILTVYSNTFDAAWHLDDYPNINHNPKIHIADLFPESIAQSMRAGHDGGDYNSDAFFRPVSMVTFALNWYFGQEDVTGYHVVNMAVHVLAAFFLFLTVFYLLDTPKIREKDRENRYEIALLCAFVWAVHPIQIQAVTYIVQRMASMAGMFYVAGLYCYLKARQSPLLFKKLFFGVFCLISFFMALGSKENAVLFPFSVILIESVFFQAISDKKKLKRFLATGCFIGIGIIVLGTFHFFEGNLFNFLKGYGNRSFTFVQRLLTEPRVICLYLYQIFYPVSSQFSIEHGVTISTSLLSPWSTLPAIGFIAFLVGLGVYTAAKIPLVCFAILFFFLNHLLESTIFPLELVFEHRNYIPSMFLFLPCASLTIQFFNSYKEKKGFFNVCIIITVTGLMAALAYGTYIRNMDWKTEESLWQSAIDKAPGNARPYQNISSRHYQVIGEYDKAIAYHEKALNLYAHQLSNSRMVSYDNLRYIYAAKNDIEKAEDYNNKALEALPNYESIYVHIELLIKAGKIKAAHQMMTGLLGQKVPTLRELNLHTMILFKLRAYEKAYEAALKALKKNPFDVQAMTYFGYANMHLGQYDKAELYLNRAVNIPSPALISICLALVENSLKQENPEKTQKYLSKLFKLFSIETIQGALRLIRDDKSPELQISLDKISKEISRYGEKIMKEIAADQIPPNT